MFWSRYSKHILPCGHIFLLNLRCTIEIQGASCPQLKNMVFFSVKLLINYYWWNFISFFLKSNFFIFYFFNSTGNTGYLAVVFLENYAWIFKYIVEKVF